MKLTDLTGTRTWLSDFSFREDIHKFLKMLIHWLVFIYILTFLPIFVVVVITFRLLFCWYYYVRYSKKYSKMKTRSNLTNINFPLSRNIIIIISKEHEKKKMNFDSSKLISLFLVFTPTEVFQWSDYNGNFKLLSLLN